MFRIWKSVGETPLQALERCRIEHTISAHTPMTYAGRLDPLAEGELIILVGEEGKDKERYLHADKEYVVEILVGIASDTGDPMGLITIPNTQGVSLDKVESVHLGQVLASFVGHVRWPYPAYSSKTVGGKPLFLWSLEGRIGEVEIPQRESDIYTLELMGEKHISTTELKQEVTQKIASITTHVTESKLLGADFRRSAVLANWDTLWSQTPLNQEWHIIQVRCRCSSGTYMRTLAQKVGEALGTQALALSITRTKVLL